jgi:hypothetical protein
MTEKALAVLRENSFAKHPERINKKGRPPLLLHEIAKDLKERGYKTASPKTVAELYKMFFNLSEDDLREYAEAEDAPMMAKIVAKSLISQKGFDVMETMIERTMKIEEKRLQQSFNSKDITITIIQEDKESAELLLNE